MRVLFAQGRGPAGWLVDSCLLVETKALLLVQQW
jgi:hypothetical protein